MKARELRMIGVALGGLALVLTAHGGEEARDEAVTVGGGSAATGEESASAGFASGLGGVVGDDAIRLLDFAEVDQTGETCAEGIEGDTPGTVRVTDGRSGLLDPERFARLIVDNNVVYGDLNADGDDEAVVHVVCAYGANGADATVEVWDLASGTPRQLASVGEPPLSLTGGFPGAVKSVAVENGELVVTWSAWGPEDPHCCATQQVTLRYGLDGRDLTPIGQPVTSAAS